MLVWVALGVLLVAIVCGVAYATIRGLQLYRNAKRSGAAITSEMDRISAATLEIEHQMAKAEAATARLNAATDRLTASRARLDVQLAAVRQARAQVRRVFWFVPGI
jgi:chromosome segregation ATPase